MQSSGLPKAVPTTGGALSSVQFPFPRGQLTHQRLPRSGSHHHLADKASAAVCSRSVSTPGLSWLLKRQ